MNKVNWKKAGLWMLFPHPFVLFVFFLAAVAGLLYIFYCHLEESLLAILFYVFSFYTLVVLCARIPRIVKKSKDGIYKNKYARSYLTDKDLRMHISMYLGLLTNAAFALFKIVTGVVYHSAWLLAMAAYNMILSLMRFTVVFFSQKKGTPEEAYKRGLLSYGICGWLILLLNVAVSVIMFLVIVGKQSIEYHMIVSIGLAAFTFYCFIRAIINMIKYRKRSNPIYAAVKCIDMVKAIVSVFTLQAAMLTSFGAQESKVDMGLMNTLTGIAVTIAINTIGAMMVAAVKRDFREMKKHGK